MKGIETERKFLIKLPSQDTLEGLDRSEITQIYITPDIEGGTERVRARRRGDDVVYTHTVKHRISAISSEEDEEEISRERFESLSQRIECGTRPIIKTRYVMPYRERFFEIDVYPFWEKTAVMEVELPSEDAEFLIPPEITVIREVSGDRSFSNHSLAKKVPSLSDR